MIVDFLKTKRGKKELETTLAVLREFKERESAHDYIFTPFVAWVKLEQLEEFLEHLVEGKELKDDTKEQLEKS